MLVSRVLVALVGLPLIVLLLFRWPTVFAALLALALLAAAWEYRGLWPADARLAPGWFLTGVALALLPRVAAAGPEVALRGLLLATMLYLTLALRAYERGHDAAPRDAAYAALGALMFGGLGGYLLALQHLPAGPWAVLWVLSTVWVADSAAYFVGQAWGRHPLAPRLSPRKTWEGLVGGVLLGTLYAGALFPAVAARWGFDPPASPWVGWGLGLLLTLLTPLGDLAESMFKRAARQKDSGHLLPGHGGLFDRMDSWLWAGVLGYAWLTLFV
ncbi:MAG: phosphatidate cytidylyltransferase [Chloroflexi bacterium]|nr:phosphatidate cytidylyltransferase [Chloroflexota bacterium]